MEEQIFDYTEYTIEIRKYPTSIAKNQYHAKYIIPKEGEIDWETIEDDKIKISWPPVYNLEGTEALEEGTTTYDIYMRKDDVLGLDTPCSLESNFEPINSEPLNTNYFIVDTEDPRYEEYGDATDVYINVLAHINQDSQILGSYDYPVTYRPLKIHLNNVAFLEEDPDEGVEALFMLGILLTIIILAICLICICRKYRAVKYKLRNQVREVGQPEFGQEMKEAKVYNRFSDPENSQS